MNNKKWQAFYRGKKVLITGGLGFIGSNLTRQLVSLGADVTLVDSMLPDYGGNLFNIHGITSKIHINYSDVRDRYSMNYLVQGKDILFNLAGTLSHVDSMTDPFTDLEINCVSQLSLLEACRINNHSIKIVLAGTRNQYGKAKKLPVKENHPQIPTDINGINCIAGEHYHLMYYRVYGIKTCSLRLTNTYGPRHQMKHSRQGVLNWFIRQIIDGKKIMLYGTGRQIRDTNYVDDVVDAFLLVGASEKVWGNAYNLGGEPVSLVDFVKCAITIHGSGSFEKRPFPDERKAIEIGDYIANWSRINRAIGWKPRVSLKEGIEKTLDYYRKYRQEYW